MGWRWHMPLEISFFGEARFENEPKRGTLWPNWFAQKSGGDNFTGFF